MPQSGDRYEMPEGSVYIVRKTAAETDGEYVEMEFLLPDGCVPPPPHVHRQGAEEYEVLEGKFDVMVDGTWQTLGPGETATVPTGHIHTFRNDSGAQVRVRNWHRPAMRFDEFIERMYETLRGSGVKGKRDPRVFIYLSKVMFEFPDTLEVARLRDRIPMRALAAIGKALPDPAR